MLRIILTLVMFGILIAGGIFLYQTMPNREGEVESAQDAVIDVVETDPKPPFIERFEKEKLVLVTENGFVPERQTVDAFKEIIWSNQTESPVYIESYPTEGENKSVTINLGEIKPKESASTFYVYKGTFRYYDRYHPDRIGYLIIE